MAAKLKGKPSKSLFEDDDLLDSLFDDKKHPVRGRANHSGPLNRTSATNNIFSMLAEEVKMDEGDTEDSDVSAADPSDILKNMKDIDDMDADLFASKKKTSSAPLQAKPLPNSGPKKDSTLKDEPIAAGSKPNSTASSTAQNHKKFTFSDSGGDEGLGQTSDTKDLEDPLADLLDDLLLDETKPETKPTKQQTKSEKSAPSPSASPILKTETSKAAKKRNDLTFDDDQDDLMDALGFDSDKSIPKKKETVLWSNKDRSETSQRPRTKLDEILESLTSPRLVERPPTGERKDQAECEEKQQHGKTLSVKEDELTFGSYQPTLGSTPEGRQARRQSVRFSTDDISPSTSDTKPKATTRQRNSADWLGLKTNDDHTFLESDAKETKTLTEAPPSPPSERRPSTNPVSADNITRHKQQRDGEENDWLARALSRKEAESVSKPSQQRDSIDLEDKADLESTVSKQVTLQTPRGRGEDVLTSAKETSSTSLEEHSSTAHSTPVRETRTKPDCPPQLSGPLLDSAANKSYTQPQHLPSHTGSRVKSGLNQAVDETPHQLSLPDPVSSVVPGSMCSVPQPNHIPNTPAAVQTQVTVSADNLQQLLLQQQMMHTQLLGLGGVVDAGILQRLKGREQQPGDHQALQACIIQLEGQVKTLQLERDQSQMLLESVQQRHKQDMELMENTHKARVKLLEESAAQRETQVRQECEDLMERLATVTRSAEQERSELQAQHQRKLAQAQQDRDREVERLRDLQRKSILEMKKDHEDQVQRLKKLKDEEIDAVTSATSQTRSLAVVIEQMEQFSSRLGDLSSRVESTHEHTAQGLEQGARHRDEQLRIMQDRLAQQQKAMAEERAYLKEIISRMDTQLNEQQRQLEKERWKMTAEQAKAESSQRALEGERQALSLQINMEREELERAKSALLEEQKSVMQHCAEERRKLAAEWSHFHTVEKQRHERAEREASSLLEKREGSIISLAQEQADLKLHTAELKQKEMAVAQERETLERLREELEREKARISSAAIKLKTRAHEVEAFSKLAAEKYEEGERALQEAKRVEADHEARLRNVHTQTERLRQQEQRILQERLRLNHLQKDTERLRQTAPITSLTIPSISADAGSGSKPDLTSALNISLPTSFANSQSMALQASLALWKYTAEKDREYLEEEHIFLENLKKRSHRSPFSTD